ncbi:MAG: UDP-N-acetylmuramoyl-tripeptide--D-alanyl-D-alanine ligase [Acidobacteria bacterium]|nr:UDP-N-acetylmuramoyl-tripeptide--D-alanyl-D-alanine ligase [Acidobacteriota bacterium]
MPALTLQEIAEAAGGRLEGGDPGRAVTAVGIDTRDLPSGALFVALRGERDGHDFVAEAFRAGAAAAMVAEGRDLPPRGALIRVEDPLAALARLASSVRGRLAACVVAVTGSSGKTITKDLAAAALAARYRVVASPRSFNNEIGVPLTLLAADDRTEVIVAEIGSRAPGHIAALAPVLRPDVGIVVNVGAAHAGMFGSREATARAKGELVEALPPGGVAVLSADDPVVAAMRDRTRARVVTFGCSPEADVRAERVVLDARARASFRVVVGAALPGMSGGAPVRLRVPGEHIVADALAAIAAAVCLGVGVAEAARAVSDAPGTRWRMEVRDAPGGWRVVNDAYNANPASSAAALKALVAMSRGRRAWAVLGEMAELGPETAEEHDRLGRLAVRLGIGRLVVVGEHARPLYEAARLEGMPPEDAVLVPDVDAAAEVVLAGIRPGDVVLVKASRAAGLERVVERIAGEDREGPGA